MNQNPCISKLDCHAICTLLGLAYDSENIRKLCCRFKLDIDAATDDFAYKYYLLHQACHHQDGPVPALISQQFNARYLPVIRVFRAMADDNLPGVAATAELWAQKSLSGTLWALLTDQRVLFRQFGYYLLHRHTYANCQGISTVQTCNRQIDNYARQLENDLENTQTSLTSQRRKTISARTALQKAEKTCNELRRENKQQQALIANLKSVPDKRKSLERQIRKLEYELSQIRQQHQQDKNQDSKQEPALTKEKGEATEDHLIPTTGCPTFSKEPCSKICPNVKTCPLQALRVAVVGGLDRLEGRYREVVEGLGAEFLFHNGKCQSGSHQLKNLVCSSDIIVFVTSVNSHTAMHVVKGMCKHTGKRFVALRTTGAHALSRALIEESSQPAQRPVR